MPRQLTLIEAPRDWQLTPEDKESARRGLAAARAALAAGRPAAAHRSAA